MSAAQRLIGQLDRVRRTGPASWTARCPAHDDNGPSLSVKEADDGRALVHCFAGCTADEVVGALGLTLADLYPPRAPGVGAGWPRMRRLWTAAELLRLAAYEATVALVITADMLAERDFDRPRLIEAARRLRDMLEAADA